MNTTIEISKAIYPKSEFRAGGTGFISAIKHEGSDQTLYTGLLRDGTLVDEIDSAMRRLISSMVFNESTGAVVTLKVPAGYTLSVALQQHYVDKYTIEPEVSSITFA